ncbi:type II toxin-antitoxin system VapC family toxin [Demequina soli]|uniref:type II toxin-antitoxin system VapC family toxin n=1 Tax=Demequina soli TaxID=1638987 RepID=UPI000784FA2C|nr:type II toxin-antitoxin system VapC family toxin [Demequina soli]
MFLVDTNVISELRKARSSVNMHVFAWADGQPPELMHTSAMCLYELERGVLQRERTDPAQGASLRRWLDTQVAPAFAGRVLAVDADVAERAAQLQVPDPAPVVDALIAATAAAHGLAVVTRNVRDFERLGVAVVDPWRPM